MTDMSRPATIHVRNGWFWLLLMTLFGGVLLVLGVDFLFDAEYFESLICLLFGAIAIYGLLYCPLMDTRVYLGEQVIEWRQRSLLGGSDFKVIPFSAVKRIDVQTQTTSKGVLFRLAIQSDECSLPLSHGYNGNKKGVYELRDKFLEILTMEVPEDDFAAELNSLIGEGKTIEAIKYIRLQKGLSITDAKKFLEERTNK